MYYWEGMGCSFENTDSFRGKGGAQSATEKGKKKRNNVIPLPAQGRVRSAKESTRVSTSEYARDLGNAGWINASTVRSWTLVDFSLCKSHPHTWSCVAPLLLKERAAFGIRLGTVSPTWYHLRIFFFPRNLRFLRELGEEGEGGWELRRM